MRKAIFNLYEQLKENHSNQITYFKGTSKITKTFSDFVRDTNITLARIERLKLDHPIKNVGIIGPTSYEWMTIDHACIKGGYKSVAIPETYSKDQIIDIIDKTEIDLLLVDVLLKPKYPLEYKFLYYFRGDKEDRQSLENIIPIDVLDESDNKILKEYSIAFSSGTSEKLKFITLKFHDIDEVASKRNLANRIVNILGAVKYRNSIFANKDNKIIIFLPFSHPMQRGFVLEGLFNKMNIVLSDPVNFLKHIITEKPNIMVSVPFIYEAMAKRIATKINMFSKTEKFLHWLYNFTRINRQSNHNFLKRLYSRTLYKDIKKIYGGRADLFITGSAPVNPDTLKIFYSIGVRVYEAYGQSELSTNIFNTRKNFKIGSVGKPPINVKIDDNSEILIKYDEKYDNHNKDILNVDNEGYIHTGDIGYLDKDGFLFIKGRKDDVIVLNQGKKVYPANIEKRFENNTGIDQVMVMTLDNMTMSTVISHSLGARDRELVIGEIEKIIKSINRKLPDYEKITNYAITDQRFTVENGLLTPTFKLKRSAIKAKFEKEAFTRIQ